MLLLLGYESNLFDLFLVMSPYFRGHVFICIELYLQPQQKEKNRGVDEQIVEAGMNLSGS